MNGPPPGWSPHRQNRGGNPLGACIVVFVLLFLGFTFGLMWGAILWR